VDPHQILDLKLELSNKKYSTFWHEAGSAMVVSAVTIYPTREMYTDYWCTLIL